MVKLENMLKLYINSFIIVFLDQLTKKIIVANMMIRDIIEVTFFLDIIHVRNTGAAFSFLHDAGGWQRYFLVTISLLVSIALPFYIKKNLHQPLLAISLSLILGGAVGNLIDRLFLGYVIDFISFHYDKTIFWPAFNIADSAITVGAILMIYDAFKNKTHLKF